MLQHSCSEELRGVLGVDPKGDASVLRDASESLERKLDIVRGQQKKLHTFADFHDEFVAAGGVQALLTALEQALLIAQREKQSFITKRRALKVVMIRHRSRLLDAQGRIIVLERENAKLAHDLDQAGVFLHKYDQAQSERNELAKTAITSTQAEKMEREKRDRAERSLRVTRTKATEALDEYARQKLDDERTIKRQAQMMEALAADAAAWKAASERTFLQECKQQANDTVSVATQTRGLGVEQSRSQYGQRPKTANARSAKHDRRRQIRPRTAPARRPENDRDCEEAFTTIFARLSRPKSHRRSRVAAHETQPPKDIHFSRTTYARPASAIETSRTSTRTRAVRPRPASAAERVRPRSAIEPRGSHFVSRGLGMRKKSNSPLREKIEKGEDEEEEEEEEEKACSILIDTFD